MHSTFYSVNLAILNLYSLVPLWEVALVQLHAGKSDKKNLFIVQGPSEK